MKKQFYTQINQVNLSENPIKLAWNLSLQYLKIENVVSTSFEDALFKNIKTLHNSNSYHNEYHYSHVVLGSAYLFKEEMKEDSQDKNDIVNNFLPLLLASIFHDAGHPGRGNNYPYELENQSTDFFKRYTIENSLEKLWNQQEDVIKWSTVENCVELLIKATEFEHEHNNVVKAYENNPEETYNTNIKINKLKIILSESDILLSCLQSTGLKQTEKILAEHNLVLNNIDEVKDKWFGFLKKVELSHYQSNAAKSFGIKEEIKNNIKNHNVSQLNTNIVQLKNNVLKKK